MQLQRIGGAAPAPRTACRAPVNFSPPSVPMGPFQAGARAVCHTARSEPACVPWDGFALENRAMLATWLPHWCTEAVDTFLCFDDYIADFKINGPYKICTNGSQAFRSEDPFPLLKLLEDFKELLFIWNVWIISGILWASWLHVVA